jgi:drug/metabolite transporter (DMT)-like permease
MDKGPSRDASGVVFILLAALGFASKAIFVKLCYREGVDAITALALRMLFSLAFFLILFVRDQKEARLQLERRDALGVIALGLLGYYLSSLLDFYGLVYITAALERLILFLYPTFVVLISWLFLKQPLTRRAAAALALSYLGMALVFGGELGATPQKDLWRGAILVFGSTVTYSLYLVGSAHVIGRIGARRFANLVSLVSAAAVLLHFFAIRPIAALHVSPLALLYAAAMGLFATVMPIYALAAGTARIGASRAAQISSVGPVVTIGLGVLLLGERMTPLQVVGAAAVIGGVSVAAKKK